MGAVILDGSVKPAQWGLDPGLVAPEWEWFWNNAHIALPLWSGGGTIARNYGIHNTTVTLTSAPWQPSTFGIGVEIADAGDEIDLNPPLDIEAWTEFTFFAYLDFKAIIGNNPGFWRANASSGGTTFNILNADDGPWIRWAGSDLIKTTSWGDMTNRGVASVGFSVGQATQTAYLDGLRTDTRTGTVTWPTGSNADIYNIGWQANTGERANGTWGAVYILELQMSGAQHLQLALDPFGPFRMVDEAAFFVPAAVAPPTINLVMAPYIPA